MPYKDPAKRKAATKNWRERSIANGYGKWLYNRRAVRFADAEHFREVLEEIAAQATEPHIIALVQTALAKSAERAAAVGPSPGSGSPKGGYAHPTKPNDSLLELLATLEK